MAVYRNLQPKGGTSNFGLKNYSFRLFFGRFLNDFLGVPPVDVSSTPSNGKQPYQNMVSLNVIFINLSNDLQANKHKNLILIGLACTILFFFSKI